MYVGACRTFQQHLIRNGDLLRSDISQPQPTIIKKKQPIDHPSASPISRRSAYDRRNKKSSTGRRLCSTNASKDRETGTTKKGRLRWGSSRKIDRRMQVGAINQEDAVLKDATVNIASKYDITL